MKKAKNKLSILYSGIITFALSALGFTSCDDLSLDKEDPIICMYGVPTAQFKISGKVSSSETKSPVREIKVSLFESTTWKDDAGIYYENPGVTLTTQTATDGSFSFTYDGFPADKKYVYLLEDVDGDANGRFLTKKDSVLLTNPKFNDPQGAWNSGRTEKDLGTLLIDPDKAK